MSTLGDLMLGKARYERVRLAKLAALATGERLLDVGYARRPNTSLTGASRHVTGIDLASPEGPSGYDREVVGDVFDLPQLAPGPYDTIVAGEFIEHVEAPYDLVRLLAGQLAPGGRLLLSTPNPLAFPVMAFELIRSKKRFFAKTHAYYFTPRWVEKLLQDCELRVTEVIPVGLWPYALPCPVGLSYQVIYAAVPA